MATELKPCAHCGADPEMIRMNNGISVQVKCKNCGIRTQYGNEEYAVRVWNRRQEEEIAHVGSDAAQMGYEK